MTLTTNSSYEFGGFVLNPAAHVLSHLDRPVELSGKDFDVLAHLVRHANSIVSTEDLISNVWGVSSAIHHGNVTNHIAKIRKVLGCDPHRPSFIRTVHGKGGYVFIAPVKQVEAESETKGMSTDLESSSAIAPEASGFQITMHIFVPVFLGPDSFDEISLPIKQTPWAVYKEYRTDGARLCILKSGIGVWHLDLSETFSTLVEVAARRKELYERVFQKKNLFLNIYTDELTAQNSLDENNPLRSTLGKPGYAYSLTVFRPGKLRDTEKIHRVLEILASPQSLETKLESRQETERLHRLERQFLERGINSLDMQEFGMTGEDLGYASWEGVSYCSQSDPNRSVDPLIEFQIAMHALWWQSKCLADAFVKDPESSLTNLKMFLPDLKRQLLVLKNIDPKETISQRTMAEAFLKVNRVEQIVGEALDLYS
mgnify:CR=1 FL=1